MRIVVDLDGTICKIRQPNEKYDDLEPLPGAVQKLSELKQQGHYIIISTARNMATQRGNLGKVIQNIGLTTLDWLKRHNIPYDEIYFGKPNAEVYIDDRAFRFEDWNSVNEAELSRYAKEK